MTPTAFPMFYKESACILGEGAVIERLRRNSGFELDPHVVNSAFIYDDAKRESLAVIYRQHLDIGHQFNLPLILSTPTWRASRERISKAGCEDKDVNGDNFQFLDQLRNECGPYGKKVAVGGLMSCRGDAFNPDEALLAAEARDFHAWQAEKLDERENLVTEAPELFGQSVGDLNNDLGMKILGGCCGTDDRHIRQLAKRLAQWCW